jgi:dTDP-4-amino-4,6-dideoxygalactose transaminase
MNKNDFIPFAKPDISDAEVDQVLECLKSGWLTTGPKALELENKFASVVGAKHAIAVNSCTAAMHLALEAMGVGPGGKVVTSVFTFTASAEVSRYLNADTTFVDIDPETLNMNPALLERTLSENRDVDVVIPVHFAGQACEMDEIMDICNTHDVQVLEDAAHAFPTTYQQKYIGSIGEATAFSFYATKTLAVGEGGMLTTDSDKIADRCRVMRLHGISRDVFDRYQSEKPSWFYEVVAPGFKYNLPDLAAGIGLAQLERRTELLKIRKRIALRYLEAFKSLPLKLPTVRHIDDLHAWHLFVIQLDSNSAPINRDKFIVEMANKGIGTSVHFIPLHRQPYWRDRYQLEPAQFPVAERVYQSCVSLPIYSTMTDTEIERVIDATVSLLAN